VKPQCPLSRPPWQWKHLVLSLYPQKYNQASASFSAKWFWWGQFYKFQNKMQTFASRGEPVSYVWTLLHLKVNWGCPSQISDAKWMSQERFIYLMCQCLQSTLFLVYRKKLRSTAESNSDWVWSNWPPKRVWRPVELHRMI